MKTKSFKEILKETIQRNCTDDYDGMFLFFESSVIEAHNEYASQFQQEWIPVEVRLPEIGTIVSITLKHSNNDVYAGFRAKGGWYCFVIGENSKYFIPNNNDVATITAWQPLPQPYNPKQS